MTEMTLQEVCKAVGVSRRAVQGYEKANLVSATGKTKRGYLLYDSAAQERIRTIKLYQNMGFSIKEIQSIIDGPKTILQHALIEQSKKIRDNISHSESMLLAIYQLLETL